MNKHILCSFLVRINKNKHILPNFFYIERNYITLEGNKTTVTTEMFIKVQLNTSIQRAHFHTSGALLDLEP